MPFRSLNHPQPPHQATAFLGAELLSGSAGGDKEQRQLTQTESSQGFSGAASLDLPTLPDSLAKDEWRSLPSQLRLRPSTEPQGLKPTECNLLSPDIQQSKTNENFIKWFFFLFSLISLPCESALSYTLESARSCFVTSLLCDLGQLA